MNEKVLRFDAQCITCILGKYINKVPADTDSLTKLEYAKGIMKIITDAPFGTSAPEIVAEVTAYKNKMFGFSDDFKDLKTYFNGVMLGFEDEFEKAIAQSADSLEAAIKFAMLGNYIDFGAMDSVDESKLQTIPEDARKMAVDFKEYEQLKAELSTAKSLIYLTDNCGEVVMDKLLIKELKKSYPQLNIEVIVRGEPVLNDATLDDAVQVGLTELVTVSGNNTNIAGTCLEKVSEEISAKLSSADIIIAKGQGNFETLHHCGLNVYYLFLCKCGLFSERFNVPKCTGMFLNDLRMD